MVADIAATWPLWLLPAMFIAAQRWRRRLDQHNSSDAIWLHSHERGEP